MNNKINEINQTIELVGHGHADRFSDYISEKILEEHLKQDKQAKVAIEILATRNSISLGGEVTSKADIDYNDIVYKAIEKTYGEKWWPNFKEVKVYNHIEEQSVELSVIQENEVLAGDQGVIYGFYDQERIDIIENLYSLMNEVVSKFELSNDWKLLYTPNVKELSMSVCGDVDHSKVKEFIENKQEEYPEMFKTVIVNPKGLWLIPGPLSDTGVVGRKLMIDTFGAGIPHGGGAFCGKDPSKVDKTGILWASHIARELYKKENKPMIVELNFKIGDSRPTIYCNGEKIENDTTTLNEFVEKYNLKDVKWSDYVSKGSSVINWLKEN